MDKKIIITGVNGFVGHHLAEKLYINDNTVIGIGTDSNASEEIEGFLDEYHSSDLTREWPVVSDVDTVIHLAGLASVGPSFDAPQLYIETNSAMITHMGEFYLKQEQKPRLIIVSSGAVYNPNQEMPLSELASIGFNSPYAVSKILVENQAAYYRQRGLDCVVVRPFNHIGPGQRNGFIVGDFYDQLIAARDLGNDEIRVGNLDSRRDYTDVRDIVAAYALLATAPSLHHFVYNVSSGNSHSGHTILDTLKIVMGITNIHTVVDPSKFRPTDAADIIGDSSRLRSETGWMPLYSLQQTITDFVSHKA